MPGVATRFVDESGQEREWRPHSEWRIGGDERRCRSRGCGLPAVAAVKRWRRDSIRARDTVAWWHYCEAHLYGCQIIGGEVCWAYPVEEP